MLLLHRLISLLLLLSVKGSLSFQPEFVESISNISVPVGRDATFKCQVKHLGGYRVGWLKADTKAIQAIHENVITHNSRVTVSHQDQSTWNLHIKAVTEEDRGGYMCQLNTDPMKSQIGFLDVVIPPDFIEDETSSDVIVAEGSTVKLTCRARGYPDPVVNWRREDGNSIVLKDSAGTKTLVSSYHGEVLKLTKIARNEMGSYLCIASNGVPPSISKRMSLSIHFHPVIQVPNQLVGAPLGTDVQIECHVEASPKSINYWVKDSGEMVVSSTKYHVQESSKSVYETKMSLIVKKFQKDDVGSYRCIAKNSLGEVDSSIRLYEIPGPNRKNQGGSKHASENDANDILKMKQVKVTYQPELEEELYGSVENYDDSDFALPPMPPNIYYTNGNKPPANSPNANANGNGNGNGHNLENSLNAHGKELSIGVGQGGSSLSSGGRHHHNHHQNQHQHQHQRNHNTGLNVEYGQIGGGGDGRVGGDNGNAIGVGLANANGLYNGGTNAIGNNFNSRKPSFQSKAENRDGLDSNGKSSAGKQLSICSRWTPLVLLPPFITIFLHSCFSS